ncbi:hypothetical protein Pelo_5177 [Pelomyxa schiedti]|nr:hypothetical protein Pelo_5177 [Pelomyxa schiedti]
MIARSPCHLVGVGHSVRDLILSGSIELAFRCSCLQVFFKGFACDDDVVDRVAHGASYEHHRPLEGIWPFPEFLLEFVDELSASYTILLEFPSIIFRLVSFPANQILSLAFVDSAINFSTFAQLLWCLACPSCLA